MNSRPDITILIFTDGRGKLLKRTVESMQDAWGVNPVNRVCIINDSADPEYADWLNREYAGYDRIHHDERRGFAGAVQSGWGYAADSEFVFHLEDDFTFNEPIDVVGMVGLLEASPNIVQVALQRQPWNDQEKAAGGIIKLWPDEYTEMSAHIHRNQTYDRTIFWCEHRLFFTTNPSFYRGSLVTKGWPDAPRSEEKFSQYVLQDPDARFAFWGRKDDGPKVEHIGDERAGTGY